MTVAGDSLTAVWKRARDGDGAAFRAWVEAVSPTLFRLAFRLVGASGEAEDVVQEAVTRAWRGAAGLREPEASLAWVCGIARHVAADRVRHQVRHAALSLDAAAVEGALPLVERLEDPSLPVDDAVASAQLRQLVRACMETLPDHHRLVLWLRDVDGWSIEETAAALGCPAGTVESRLHRARAALGKKVRGATRRRGWRFWS